MNDKKNIDRLFQERFKDFESVPDDKIWSKIHDSLHEKKSRKVVPFWWKLSGIAAAILIAFLIFNPFSNNFTREPAVVLVPQETENSDSTGTNLKNETQIAVESKNSTEKEKSSTAKENDLIHISNSNSSKINSELRSKNQSSNNTAVAQISKEAEDGKNLNDKNPVSSDAITFNPTTEKISEKNNFQTESKNIAIDKVELLKENNERNNRITGIEKDSSSIKLNAEPNPLEEILRKKNEKEEEVIAVAKMSKWQVSTNVAPVYFNSASNGSPIEAQFEKNSKSYKNNLSIGVGVQYAVNKKFSIRTGLNTVDLSYGTNDIVFFGTLSKSGISTVSPNNSASHVEVISANNIVGLRPFSENLENTESGVLNQKMGYYEIPLEVSYAVLDKKFGIRLIGGMSTLLLNDNAISVQSATTMMSLGKANNLNDVHFSGNAGLSFNYQFWNSFEAHFEPTLKYQLNTFSRDAGNFKPYFVGLYTGISFKF